MNNAADIRQAIKYKRSALTKTEVTVASAALNKCFLKNFELEAGSKLGAYIAVGNEIKLRSIIEHAWQADVQVFLPVLCTENDRQLWFAPYHADTAFKENKFGIPEPDVRTDELILPDALDMVLMPLVAFDGQGHRIGMGGGYYDTSFESVKHCNHPKLIGCAYEFQKVAEITPNEWDVSCHVVVTDQSTYSPHK